MALQLYIFYQKIYILQRSQRVVSDSRAVGSICMWQNPETGRDGDRCYAEIWERYCIQTTLCEERDAMHFHCLVWEFDISGMLQTAHLECEGLLGSGIMITLSVTLSERFNDVRTFILEISQDLLNTSHPSHRIEKLLDQTYYAFSFQFLAHMCPIQLKDHQVLGRAILLILLVILKVQPKGTFPPRTAEDIIMATLHLTTRNFPTITQGVPIPYALPIVKDHE